MPLLEAESLGDQRDKFRGKMLAAAAAFVRASEATGSALLLSMIKRKLNASAAFSGPALDIEHVDRIRENLVICLGAVAECLPTEDPRISTKKSQRSHGCSRRC